MPPAACCPARPPRRSGIRCRHRQTLSFGLNCALGATNCGLRMWKLSRIADTCVSAHPNAGLPNAFGEYDLNAGEMAAISRMGRKRFSQHRRRLLRHHAHLHPRHRRRGGRICRRARFRPSNRRLPPERSGAVHHHARLLFVNVGERTNVTGSPNSSA
jgi:5-methyltetrahydrofolate--homocysteine methyltransferase